MENLLVLVIVLPANENIGSLGSWCVRTAWKFISLSFKVFARRLRERTSFCLYKRAFKLSSMPNDPQSRGASFIRYYQVPVLNQSLANLVSRAKFDVWSQWVSSVCWPPLPSLSLERGQHLILMPKSLFTPLKCRRRVQMYETKCLCKQVRETQLASWAWAF